MKTDGRLFRFLLVGGVATLCQYAILIALVEGTSQDPVVSSAIGAFFGAMVNYWLNKTLTFQSSAHHTTTLPRFFVVAITAMALNALLMALFTNFVGFPYIFSQIITTVLIVLFTYNANRIWTFKG